MQRHPFGHSAEFTTSPSSSFRTSAAGGLKVFDRYAPFTDIALLKAASTKPLRKCVRVNTLKCSVEEFRQWAEEKRWTLTPVPWCPEGFFVDRFVEQEYSCPTKMVALGRDLRHLLGHFYMQEAASMLPVALLDPQPGEMILDLCAAPGSKTTQIAARVACHPELVEGRHAMPNVMVRRAHHDTFGSGVVLANDMQEKRLRILNDAVQRTGATNVIIVRKVGQWYARHMTERFDRVLCDAPCTAQGTIRKDPTALTYCSPESIAKAARLQFQLLEAAIHATKIGGRIVYSTCTLTPEENEMVVREILNKFCEQVEVVDPLSIEGGRTLQAAVQDSIFLQQQCGEGSRKKEVGGIDFPLPTSHFPLVRLWPQTYDTEGFFLAVLRKTKRTKEPERMDTMKREAEPLTRAKREAVARVMTEHFGTDFLSPGDALVERGQQVLLTTEDAAAIPLPVPEYACGIPFAKILKDGRYRVTNELVSLRGSLARGQTMDLSEEQLSSLLSGKELPCDPSFHGDAVLRFRGIAVGLGLAKESILLNRLPRWVVKHAEAQPSAPVATST